MQNPCISFFEKNDDRGGPGRCVVEVLPAGGGQAGNDRDAWAGCYAVDVGTACGEHGLGAGSGAADHD